jgi:hypothetical protein
MSQSFRGGSRGGGPKVTQRFDEYDEFEDGDQEEGIDGNEVEDIPPVGKLFIGFLESAWGAGSNVVQVLTSAIAIMSLIIGGTTIGFTGVPDLMHKFPMFALIGMGIAGSIQIILHMNASPIRKTMGQLRHIESFDVRHMASWKDVGNAVTIRSMLFLMAAAGDIVSDATFINLYTHNPLVILFWIVFTTGSSTIVMYDGWSRVWQAFEDWRDYRRYHRAYDNGDEFVG